MKIVSIITILITLLFVSCLNDGPFKNCDQHYFSDEYKSYVFFKEGSYWIYQDTLNNKIDSVYLLHHNVSLNDYCIPSSPYEEILEQSYYSSFFNKFTDTIGSYGHASRNTFNGGVFSGDFSLYMDSGNWQGITYELLDSLQINNYWYKDVRILAYDFNKYYWAKDIGLVKKTFTYYKLGDTIYDFEILKFNIVK